MPDPRFLADPPCRRCGASLCVDAVSGARFCRSCRRRERPEVLAFFRVEMEHVQRAVVVLDAQAREQVTP